MALGGLSLNRPLMAGWNRTDKGQNDFAAPLTKPFLPHMVRAAAPLQTAPKAHFLGRETHSPGDKTLGVFSRNNLLGHGCKKPHLCFRTKNAPKKLDLDVPERLLDLV